ncbi:MAG: hypothetical protein GYB66_01695 [Chloroflexi bacterium]|nr:hypothetical protein [Chloroflexota bacterium]
MHAHILRRTVPIVALLVALGVVLWGSTPSAAQDGDEDRRLIPNEPISGTLDTESFAESYVFDASADDEITLTVTTDEEALSLALMLTGPGGEILARDGDLETPQAADITEFALPQSGQYLVTVLRGTGAEGDASGEFTLTLTGNITLPDEDEAGPAPTIRDGENVYVDLSDGGIEISLQWFTAVDLNLEVRDPVGGTLYFDSLSVASGGSHNGNVNGLCEDATSDNPTESVSWPQGFVPAGSYEIIIYYEQACAVGGPQSFNLTATINGDDPQSISGVLNPGQRYLARVSLDIDRDWTIFNGGVNAGLDLAPVANIQEIDFGQTVEGSITNEKPKDAWTFTVAEGQTITVDMAATSGSLDTLLILIGPDGQRVADNDDQLDGGTTDSLIQAQAPVSGEYTIIATRYGQVIGGTEGNYLLTLGTEAVVADGGTETLEPGTDTSTDVETVGPPQGNIEVTLEWFTDADLQLLVRDPSGDAVFDDVPSIASGGILDQNYVGNRGCERTQDVPTSYIYWPTNRFPPTGTYEVEIWFQSDCNDPTPVQFNLSIEVNGQLLAPVGSDATVTATATAVGNRYMITFTIDDAGTVTLGDGGFFDMNSVATSLDYQAQLATAEFIEYDETVQGEINQNQKFVVYRFEGIAGDRIAVEMRAVGNSSLDTAVYVLDPSNVPLAGNDDIEPGVDTNSLITDLQLPRDGTYYIIATHYGLQYGATSGNYTLTLLLAP